MASFFTAPRLVSLMIVVGTISCLPIQPAGQVTSASEYDYPTTMGDLANDDYQGPTVRPAPVGVILPVLVISLLLIAALVAALSACRGNPEKVGENDGEPEEQFNLILCHEDNAQFEYNLILRVGCPTPNFDMKKGYIDFEILGENDEITGNPVRFDCSLLPDRICGEMHCLIGSMAPLPNITGIRISHGDQFGTIFLYEYVLINLADDSVLEVRKFNTYISSKHNIYRGILLNDDDDKEVGLFPDLPLVELTKVEAVILTALAVMFSGTFTMLFEYFNWYPVNRSQDGSMYRSLFDVLVVGPMAIFVLGAIALVFKYYIKRNVLQHEYSIKETDAQHWRCISCIVLATLSGTALALTVVFVYLGLQISFTKSLFWFSSTLIVSVCVIGSWVTLSKSIWFKSFFEEEAHARGAELLDNKRQSALKRLYASQSRSGLHDKTVFFSNRLSKPPSASFLSLAPKWCHPKEKTSPSVSKRRAAKKQYYSLVFQKSSVLPKKKSSRGMVKTKSNSSRPCKSGKSSNSSNNTGKSKKSIKSRMGQVTKCKN